MSEENSYIGPVTQMVEQRWADALSKVDDGFEAQSDIIDIEAQLQYLHNNTMSEGIDQEDLFVANKVHLFYKADVYSVRLQRRENLLEYYKITSQRLWSLSENLSFFGIKTLILLHGALAISSIAGITQTQDSELQKILGSAIGFALIGITLAGLGVIFMTRQWADLANKWGTVWSSRPNQKGIQEINKEINRRADRSIWIDWIFYISFAIFIGYSFFLAWLLTKAIF